MNKKHYVVKSNAIIESRLKLTPTEHKLINCLVSEIRTEDENFREYHLNIKEFGEFVGANSNDTVLKNQLHKSARTLMEKVITYKRGKFTVTTALLASAKTSDDNQKLLISLSPEIKNEFIDLKTFTKYRLENILKMDGGHAIRIYELLISKKNNRIPTNLYSFKIDELKYLLGIENKYSKFAEFERRILQPSKREINEKTDLFITYKKVKNGKTYDSIVFEVEKKYDQKELDELNIKPEIKKLREQGINTIQLLREYVGLEKELFSDAQAMALFQISCEKLIITDLDPIEYIKATYDHLKNLKKTKKINSNVGYLKILIEKDAVKMIENYFKHLAEEVDYEEQVEGQISIDEL